MRRSSEPGGRGWSGLASVAVLLLLSLPLPTESLGEGPRGGWRASYHTYASMTQELRALEAAHPDMVRVESLGKTYEGRDIWAVKLSDDAATNDSSEPDVLIMGGLHAREIMGVEVPLYLLDYLVRSYGLNESCTTLVNTREIWFVPMANPDGHVYVEAGNDWRKNRRPTTGGNIGVDLNRNWGYMFGVDNHTSDDPSSEVYHGPHPFSENETLAISGLALRQRFATSVSFHSYGRLVLYPWGYTSDPAPDRDELRSMALAMASMNGYTPQQSAELYITHGSSDDWLYANTSTLALTFELDTSFYPPESQIETTCALNREAAIYLVKYPSASIIDAGVRDIKAPTEGSLVEPDRPLNITVEVMNYGTAIEEVPVELELASPEGYSHRNLTNITLRPGAVGEVSFHWLPPFVGAESYTASVRTNLSGDPWGWNDAASRAFKIKSKYGAAVSTNETAKECYAGQSVVYGLNVSSLSNREDDILLELEGARRDWVSVVDRVHLPPAGWALVNMTVSAPRGATPGERANVVIRALSSTGMGASGLLSTTTTVLDPSPIAEAGPDIAVNVSEEFELDGSRSTAPLGSLVQYSWNLGDGNMSEGVRVRHTYEGRGVYTVTLTVESDLGWTGSDSLKVAVDQLFSVGLEAEREELLIRPGATAVVDVTLRNLGNGPDVAALSLDALRWSASLSTTLAALQRGESIRVALNITAPQRALAGETAQFRVRASSLEAPYASDEVLIAATVAEVRELVLEAPDAESSSDAGSSVVFTLQIRNGGNVEERVNLTLSGVPEGWAVALSTPSLVVPPWGCATIEIPVQVPPGALAGGYRIFVSGTALNVLVLPRYALEASVEEAVLTAKPGETVVFKVDLSNAGNAPDSYTPTLSGVPEGWASGPASALEVAPGASVSTSASVLVPRGARAGRYDLTLEARSGNDTEVLESIPVHVVVERPEDSVTTAPTPAPPPPMVLLALVAVVAAAGVGARVLIANKRRRARQATAPASPEGEAPGAQALAGLPEAQGPTVAQPGEWLTSMETTELRERSSAKALVAAQERRPECWETCLWCFERIGSEPSLVCPSCEGAFHGRCAAEAAKCTRCGGALHDPRRGA